MLRNLDEVPQIFGPTLMMPGQSFRLPFEVGIELSVRLHGARERADDGHRGAVAGDAVGAAALARAELSCGRRSHDPSDASADRCLPRSAVDRALIVGVWWAVVVAHARASIFPTPWQVVTGTLELVRDGTLWEHIGASLMRVGDGLRARRAASRCRSACGWAGCAARTTR